MNWAQEDILFLSSQAWLPNPAETFSSGAKWSGKEACQHNTTAWDKGSKEKMGTWASSHSTSRQDVFCGQGMPDPYRVTTLGMIKPTFHSCWWFDWGLSLPALSLYAISLPFLGVHHTNIPSHLTTKQSWDRPLIVTITVEPLLKDNPEMRSPH